MDSSVTRGGANLLHGRGRSNGLLIVVALSVLLGSLASWGWAGRVRGAQAQERSDLNLFLDASSAGWAEVTDQFFTIPESAAQTIGALFVHMNDRGEMLSLLGETIRTSPSLDAAFIGFPNGEFVFVGRADESEGDGFRTRSISIDDDQRTVELTWTDAEMVTTRSQLDPEDTYDPRARPWYISPELAVDQMWTPPYVFASSQQPGITHSTAVFDSAGEQVAVVGIDIRLTQLGEFLDLLAPGPNGEALVIDDAGEVIAASAMDSPTGDIDLSAGAMSGEYIDDVSPLIAELSTAGVGVALERSPDGLRTTVARSARSNDEWYLAVQALDDDFLGDFSNGSAKNLFGIIAVGLASAIVVGFVLLRALRHSQALREEAERDELTSVLTRRAFKRVLDQTLQGARVPISIAIIDLDRFKAINDEHGHPIGDLVLAGLAARIESFAKTQNGAVGRLGGDEFAVVIEGEADWMALSRSLAESIHVAKHEFSLGASIGVAITAPGEPTSVDEVLREADHELFEVKRAGRGSVSSRHIEPLTAR